jgi:hypothetical protein
MLSSSTTILSRHVSRKFFLDTPEQRQKLAWVLLIELTSYSFASSVRWIETQDLFFEQYEFDWFPTKVDSTVRVRCAFCDSKHQKEIYYQFEHRLIALSTPLYSNVIRPMLYTRSAHPSETVSAAPGPSIRH